MQWKSIFVSWFKPFLKTFLSTNVPIFFQKSCFHFFLQKWNFSFSGKKFFLILFLTFFARNLHNPSHWSINHEVSKNMKDYQRSILEDWFLKQIVGIVGMALPDKNFLKNIFQNNQFRHCCCFGRLHVYLMLKCKMTTKNCRHLNCQSQNVDINPDNLRGLGDIQVVVDYLG
jgi:hypothetical protein